MAAVPAKLVAENLKKRDLRLKFRYFEGIEFPAVAYHYHSTCTQCVRSADSRIVKMRTIRAAYSCHSRPTSPPPAALVHN